jgi:hypothetical protein
LNSVLSSQSDADTAYEVRGRRPHRADRHDTGLGHSRQPRCPSKDGPVALRPRLTTSLPLADSVNLARMLHTVNAQLRDGVLDTSQNARIARSGRHASPTGDIAREFEFTARVRCVTGIRRARRRDEVVRGGRGSR